MKHNYAAVYANVLLHPMISEDIKNLRILRNTTQQRRFLRPVGHITHQMQKAWIDDYLEGTIQFDHRHIRDVMAGKFGKCVFVENFTRVFHDVIETGGECQ